MRKQLKIGYYYERYLQCAFRTRVFRGHYTTTGRSEAHGYTATVTTIGYNGSVPEPITRIICPTCNTLMAAVVAVGSTDWCSDAPARDRLLPLDSIEATPQVASQMTHTSDDHKVMHALLCN